MNEAEKFQYLRAVPLFSGLDDASLRTAAELAEVRRYAANRCIVTELEFGDDVYVIAHGRAQVSVSPQTGERVVLGEIGPGSVFGEMASLTGELRSATVRALTAVEVLVLSDETFDRLRACRPQVAVSLVRILLTRLVEAERALGALLAEGPKARVEPNARPARSTLSVLWRELVVNHRKDLAFLALSAFALTLIAVRLVVYVAFRYELWPRDVLRAAYVSGFILVMLGACAAILSYRPKIRRLNMLAFGIGSALIVNELGVTLAFDIFYRGYDLDPALVFDIETLYRRAEPARAIVVGLVLLFQAVYLGTFYRRLWQLSKHRLKSVLGRR